MHGMRLARLAVAIACVCVWVFGAISTAPASAATTCVQLTDGFSSPHSQAGEDFATIQKTVRVGPGAVTLSGDCNGTDPITVNDGFKLDVTKPDGTSSSSSHDFSNGCSGFINGSAPFDVSSQFAPGDNSVTLHLQDLCGQGGSSSTDVFLVFTDCSDVQVGQALAHGCFNETSPGVFETDGTAWVGGFELQPRPGGKLTVVPGDHDTPLRAGGAGVDLVLGDIRVNAPLDELKPFVPSYTFGLNTSGSFGRFAVLPLVQGASGQVDVSWASGGTGASLTAQASLEKMTNNVGSAFAAAAGTSVGTLAAKLTLTLVNGQEADVTQGSLQIPEIAVQLNSTSPPLKEGFGGGKFTAQKVNGKVEWSAEVSILFPWQNASGSFNQGTILGRLFYTDGQLGGVGLGASGFEEPIGETGWDLTGVEGNLILSPTLAFDFGIAAEQHKVFKGEGVFKLTGNVKGLRLAKADCGHGSNPFEFTGTANVPPLEQADIGTAKLQVVMCAYVQSAAHFAFEAIVSGDLSIDGGPLKKLFAASGKASGWFHGIDFNLDGKFQLEIPVVDTIRGTGVLSSEGYAFCGQFGFVSAGFGTQNWVDRPTDLLGCDLTPFRVATPSALAAAAGSVRVPARQKLFGIAVRGAGSGAAPRVRLLGPHGENFVTPADASALKSSAAIILPIDQLHTTYVYLHRPAAGRWRIQALPGSAATTRVETAKQLPRQRIHASVKVKGGKATLHWRARAIRGQRIQLVDRAQGIVTVLQRATGRAHGKVHFRPADPLATRRHIEALVFNSGLPRARVTVAHYHLRAPARLRRVRHGKARRTKKGRIAVSWHHLARAHDYLVTFTQRKTLITRVITRRTKLTLSGAPAGAITVKVQARDAFARGGRSVRLRVRR